jgi:transcriptional regulator with XRE-family HTH domain
MLTPFGRLVRKTRIDRAMRLKEMADKLGMSSAYLSGIETGAKPIPKGDFVAKVAAALEMSQEEVDQLTMAVAESTKIIQFQVDREVKGAAQVAAFARRLPLSDEQVVLLEEALREIK